MKRTGLVLCAMAAMALLCSAALAGRSGGDASTSRKAKKDGKAATQLDYQEFIVDSDVDSLTKDLSLTDGQVAKLKEKLQQRKAALEAWDKENADAFTSAYKALADAQDHAAVVAANKQISALDSERCDLVFTKQKDVMDVFSAEQKITWATQKLNADVQFQFRLSKLDDDQTAKAKALAADAAKSLVDAAQIADVLAAKGKLYKDITDTVLTDKQREDLKALENTKGHGGKGGRQKDNS